MSTAADIQVTEEGILLPRAIYQDWGDIQVIKGERCVIVCSKGSDTQRDRSLAVYVLRADGLLAESGLSVSSASPEERAELAEKLSVGQPLSEVVIRERESGW